MVGKSPAWRCGGLLTNRGGLPASRLQPVLPHVGQSPGGGGRRTGSKRYDPKRKFASWLLSIAANYCIDQHRKKRAAFVDIEAVAPAELVESNPGVERQIVVKEDRQEIQTLLADLGPLDRAAIVLHYWHDYSYVEIADELQLSESAVKSRLHRARKSLAFAWQAQGANSDVLERRQHEAAMV
jgi:RNA polymerase sigma-70 factor (ECF subfamily)